MTIEDKKEKRLYALVHDGVVTQIGTQFEKDNTDLSHRWIPIHDKDNVRVGYRYDTHYGTFEKMRHSIEDEKHRLVLRTTIIFENKMRAFLSTYSQYEIMTFSRQDQEMLVWKFGTEEQKARSIVLLKHLAQHREIPMNVLMERLEVKTNAFCAITGSLIGDRQRLEDRILAAVNYDMLDEIEEHMDYWEKQPLPIPRQ